MPNGYKVFLDNNVSDYNERLEIVNRLILEYNNKMWQEYFNDTWLNEQTVVGQKINVTRNVLDRVATYLLMGQYREGNILTSDKEEKIKMTEIPVSSTKGTNIEDYIYSSGGTEEGEQISVVNVTNTLTDAELEKDIYSMKKEDFVKLESKDKVRVKRYKETRSYKLEKLRSTPEIRTYRIKPVTYFDEEGKRQIAKTLDGQVVLDVEYVTIGGHKGLIGVGEPFYAEWCRVDIDNVFEFNNKKYYIDKSLKQYEVKCKAVKIDNEVIDMYTNEAEMESILCIMLPNRNGEIHFFDENIDEISPDLIHQL